MRAARISFHFVSLFFCIRLNVVGDSDLIVLQAETEIKEQLNRIHVP